MKAYQSLISKLIELNMMQNKRILEEYEGYQIFKDEGNR